MVNKTIFLLIINIYIPLLLSGQSTIDKNIYVVLNKNKISKNYQFIYYDKNYVNKKNELPKAIIKYLGILNLKDSIKVITYSSIAGRGSASIYLFDRNNKYLGRYYLGDKYDLPNKILKNKLIFVKNNNSCRAKTEIDFINGIPKQIFLYCKGVSGDIYSFTSE